MQTSADKSAAAPPHAYSVVALTDTAGSLKSEQQCFVITCKAIELALGIFRTKVIPNQHKHRCIDSGKHRQKRGLLLPLHY